jgi:S-adenosylmethionine:tRNA ribosyltransferase-isomerase
MVVQRDGESLEHRCFSDITEFLRPGDLLVLNDTKVEPVRLILRRKTGGRMDVLLVSDLGGNVWSALVNSRGRLTDDEELLLPGENGVVRVSRLKNGFRDITFARDADVREIIRQWGSAPLPPYIKRERDNLNREEDIIRYQTVYARNPGSIAAPTAGLHFTDNVLEKLRAGGIRTAVVTLHVGTATFLPIKSDVVEDHNMLTERYEIPEETMDAIRSVKSSGGRVVAVGTTTCRTLETAGKTPDKLSGETDLFIRPPFEFKVVDALLTNFHLPKSTLLLLVYAFAGVGLMRRAYDEAVREKYRFYSYGDAMLIL